MSRACVLLSGGLDSAALVGHYLERGFTVYPVYVAGHLRWEKAELYWTRRFLSALKSPKLKELRVVTLDQAELYPRRHWAREGKAPPRGSRWVAVHLHGRNLLLLSKAGVVCAQKRIPRVALALLEGNPFLDSRPRFFRAMEAVFRTGLGAAIRIEAPFAKLHKRDIVARYRDLPLHLTFSCAQPKGRLHCGECSKCAERQYAFRRNRLPDPTRYAG